MPEFNDGIDPNVLQEFVDESEECLQGIPALFVLLEKDPENKDIINRIFRPIHSLKGNSAFFGLLHIKELSHKMETLLDMARQGQIVINEKRTDLLLAGLDALIEMLDRARAGKFYADESLNTTQLMEELSRESESTVKNVVMVTPETVARLQNIHTVLSRENHPQQDEMGVALQQLAYEINMDRNRERSGLERADLYLPPCAMELRKILSKKIEKYMPEDESVLVGEYLEEMKECTTSQTVQAEIEKAIDDYKTIVSTAGLDNLLREILLESVNRICSTGAWKPVTEKTKNVSGENEIHANKTMRVAEKNIDEFLEYVGELITVREMFKYLRNRLGGLNIHAGVIDDFNRANESFSTLSHNLQKSIMKIRRIPVRGVLQKVPRIVRDIANAAGKVIEVRVCGEEVEIDKSILEAIESPLVHMVRNMADHGIESPEIRVQAGKPAQGTVSVEVVDLPDVIEIKVGDDGKGIDFASIHKKAASLGLVAKEQNMTADELGSLIFISGVSTAQKVTDISGRGVGMDVVKRNIEKVGGKISLQSDIGKGTNFFIRIPKAIGTQIINGFIVRVGEHRFVIPSEEIVEVFNPLQGDFTTIGAEGKCVKRRGELIPFHHISDTFSVPCVERNNRGITVISVRHNNRRAGFGVDEILGIQEVVVKTIDGFDRSNAFFSGAAITGNGEVSMIVDINSLFNNPPKAEPHDVGVRLPSTASQPK